MSNVVYIVHKIHSSILFGLWVSVQLCNNHSIAKHQEIIEGIIISGHKFLKDYKMVFPNFIKLWQIS